MRRWFDMCTCQESIIIFINLLSLQHSFKTSIANSMHKQHKLQLLFMVITNFLVWQKIILLLSDSVIRHVHIWRPEIQYLLPYVYDNPWHQHNQDTPYPTLQHTIHVLDGIITLHNYVEHIFMHQMQSVLA